MLSDQDPPTSDFAPIEVDRPGCSDSGVSDSGGTGYSKYVLGVTAVVDVNTDTV
uniref:Uncharacterized protein n=1 Tax=Magallana gigas TaxID=29159 RepID=K1QAK1_MAGGI